MWKIVNDITNPKSKESITLMEKDVLITNKKVVANTLNEFFVEKIKDLKSNIDPAKTRDPLTELKEKMSKSSK